MPTFQNVFLTGIELDSLAQPKPKHFLEPQYEPAFTAWSADRSDANREALLQAISPVIANNVALVGNADKNYLTIQGKILAMPDGSGHVYVDVPVTAAQSGSLGNLTRGMDVSSLRGNIAYFVRAFAVETFVGGTDDESTHDLIQRMIHGISAKVLSSRINMPGIVA